MSKLPIYNRNISNPEDDEIKRTANQWMRHLGYIHYELTLQINPSERFNKKEFDEHIAPFIKDVVYSDIRIDD